MPYSLTFYYKYDKISVYILYRIEDTNEYFRYNKIFG